MGFDAMSIVEEGYSNKVFSIRYKNLERWQSIVDGMMHNKLLRIAEK